MRLTAELIQAAPAYMNPCKQREINLRGFKIGHIENLGVTNDEYEVLDLSDNEITRLENFPRLARLHTLLLHNNRLAKVQLDLQQNLPHLEALMLCNNRLASLSDLDPLSSLLSLRTLSLLNNPVARLADYRLYVIHLLPRLHSLDFAKVKPKEREAALQQFGPPPTAAAMQEAAQASTIAALQAARQPEKVAPGQAVPMGQAVSLSTSYAQPSSYAASSAAAATPRLSSEELSAEKQRLVGLIAAATKLEEVNALQKQLETLIANNA